MESILSLTERVQNNIQLGESHFREFKSAYEGKEGEKKPRNLKLICKDIAEALVGFANADGGDLLIGVEDNGEITGIPYSDTDIDIILNTYKTNIMNDQPIAITFCEKLKLSDKTILFFSVNKSTDRLLQLSDGRCMRRKDKETIPVDVESLLFERREQKSREFDREFIDGASVSDLDIELLTEISLRYLPNITPEKYLQQVGLAEYSPSGLRLRKAAIVLFAKNIDFWFPRHEIRLIKVEGTDIKTGQNYNVTVDQRFSGNAFTLLTNGWDFIRSFLIIKTEFGQDATFESKYVYPELACREALVNAIAHRDYTITNPIEFILYDNRLEIKSPGLLLSTININDITSFKNVHESRNTLIAKILRENNYMRELGEGIRRIYIILNESEIGEPKIESRDASFKLTIENKSIYTTKELEWLSLFEMYKLTKLQKRIVALGLKDKEISPHDIYTVLNTNDRNIYDSTVTSLRVLGIMEQTRDNRRANIIAKSQNISKQRIGRFKIVPPGRARILQQQKILTAIFVYNLPYVIEDKDLRSFFEQFGTVKKFNRPINSYNGYPYNYCFVHFESIQVAQDLIRKGTININGVEANISEYIEKKRNYR